MKSYWSILFTYLTSNQSFIITTISYLLAQKLWALLLSFDWLVRKQTSSVQTLQPIILIYMMGNFVKHHLGKGCI